MQGAQKIYLPHVPGRPLAIKQILRYVLNNNNNNNNKNNKLFEI